MFGIHIGNTNASVAFCKETGETVVITNASGERLMPACVTITKKGVCVGRASEVLNSLTTITNNKSLMNKNNTNCGDCKRNIEIQVKDNFVNYCIPLDEKLHYFTPQKIGSFIFEELLVCAKSILCVDNSKLSCVLLAPSSFGDDYCEIYKQAAEAAGWRVIQIINEAAAAVLAYSVLDNKYEPPQNVLVYRLGGSTCEVTAFELYDGMMTSLGSSHTEDIGGNHFVLVVANFLSDEFFRKYKLDPRENRRSVVKLNRASLNCIQILSNLPTVNCLIESFHEGIDFSVNLSRARFDQLTKPLLERCLKPLQTLVNNLQLKNSVEKVFLCGGGTNIPSIKQAISKYFEDTTTQIMSHINPQEVLAIGAAKQAYYINCSNHQDPLPRSMDITLEVSD